MFDLPISKNSMNKTNSRKIGIVDLRPNIYKVGIWKRNTISIVTRKTDIPKDFKEISVQFNEHIAHTQFFTA